MQNKSFTKLVLIILIETALFMLMGTIDTIMLSGYSDNAVAAVGLADQAISLAFMLFTVISTGTIILISQYIGAERIKNAENVAIISLIISFLSGILLSGIFIVFNEAILSFLSVDSNDTNFYNTTQNYLLIVSIFMPFAAMNPVVNSIFRGFNKAKISLYISLFVNIINIIGNAMFIYGWFGAPILGPIGVAYSTAFSRTLKIVITIILLKYFVKITPHENILKNFFKRSKEVFKVGTPSALEGIIYQVMQFVVLAFVSGYLGTTQVTTRIYVLKLTMFIFLASLALAQANQIYVGNFVGRKEFDRALKHTNKVFIVGAFISLSMTLLFNIFNDQLLGLFTNDSEIIRLGKSLLLLTFFVEFGRSLNLIYAFALKGSGDVNFPLITAFISMWGVVIPLTYFSIQLGYGLMGVWAIYAFDEIIRGILAIIHWQTGKWKKKALVK
ncbi:MATE family efflux transporter [Haloplasma contractile]|nr:MATE family efflux transporter [Haloplasma contractile]